MSCRQTDQGQGHSKDLLNQNMIVSTVPSKLQILLLPNFVWWYINIISWSVVWEIGLPCSRSRSQQKFKMSVNVCLDDIFSVCPIVSAQYLVNRWAIFFTKLGMVVYYHEAMCPVEKLVHYLHCQGHSKGLYDENKTIFTVSSKLLVRLPPNLI